MAVVLARQDGAIGWIIFNRPEVLNAINYEVMDVFRDHLKRFVDAPDVRVIAITGEGRAFSTGADISILARQSVADHRAIMERGHAMMAAVEAAPKPVIAAVNGIAAGGGFELAISCDFVIAERRARFGMTEIRYGFLPGGSGTQRLPRKLSSPVAKYLLWTGEMITAERAAELDLVLVLVEDGTLSTAVKNFAAPLVARSAAAVSEGKALVQIAYERPLKEGFKAEIEANLRLLKTPEARNALAAFINRSDHNKPSGRRR